MGVTMQEKALYIMQMKVSKRLMERGGASLEIDTRFFYCMLCHCFANVTHVLESDREL